MDRENKSQDKQILHVVLMVVLFIIAFDALTAFGSGLGAGFFDGLNS